MEFKVFLIEDGKAVDADSVSAPDWETAKAFLISEGFREVDFTLSKEND